MSMGMRNMPRKQGMMITVMKSMRKAMITGTTTMKSTQTLTGTKATTTAHTTPTLGCRPTMVPSG